MNSNKDHSTAAARTHRVHAATRATTAAALGQQSNRENQTSLESRGRDQTMERRQEEGLPGNAAQRRNGESPLDEADQAPTNREDQTPLESHRRDQHMDRRQEDGLTGAAAQHGNGENAPGEADEAATRRSPYTNPHSTEDDVKLVAETRVSRETIKKLTNYTQSGANAFRKFNW